jgi:beta-glucosidase
VDKSPAFPFGFGLSYTQFVLSEVEINQRPQVNDPEVDQWDLQIEVQNTGDLPGKETIQIYIEDPESSLPRPARSLVGFKKVLLPPGGKHKVLVSISLRDLAFYSPEQKAWVAEKGVFHIHGGTSSANTRVIGEITLVESLEWGYNRG